MILGTTSGACAMARASEANWRMSICCVRFILDGRWNAFVLGRLSVRKNHDEAFTAFDILRSFGPWRGVIVRVFILSSIGII